MLLRTQVHYVLRELASELEQGDALLGVLHDVLRLQVEKSHVAHVVKHLVEADVLMRQFFPFFLATHAACLYVPNRYRNLLLL